MQSAWYGCDILITQSNLDDSLQIQQMRQMIDGGVVDAIIICCSNLTALNKTIEYGWSKGIPTLSFTGFTTSPVSINTSVNYRLVGVYICLLYTSPSPRDATLSRMPSSA